MKFTAQLILSGKTATGVQVPESIVTALGKGKRPPVSVTINGYTYPSTVAPMGGDYWIPVSAEVRENTGVVAGDEIDVDLVLDEEPRTIAVPADLTTALEAEPGAKAHFDALSYSNQRRHVLQVDGAKTPETRQRRIAKIVQEFAISLETRDNR